MEKRDEFVHLLECTLRDGSYAVNFQFTKSDTSLLVNTLSNLGFRWIEVGHGLGLGASRKGKGDMPATDIDLIRTAKAASGEALIGMFCIPGLAELTDLKRAAEHGLDFVRVGQDASKSQNANEFLEYARKIGLRVAFNFMKSYTVSALDFAFRAKAAREHGAEIIYLVDSVGGMLPDDVARYLDAANDKAEGEMGFHGHDNLRMAVSNCLKAYEHGARFLDTTMYGLGRGAGNAATEALTAVLAMQGVETGLDVATVLEAVENCMWPLMSRTEVPNVMQTAMGYGQFHSSFYPTIRQAALRYDADPKRLVIAMGKVNPLDVDPDILDRKAKDLSGTHLAKRNETLVAFEKGPFAGHKINTSMKAVKDLVDRLYTTCAKKRLALPVIELYPSLAEAVPDILSADFVREGSNYILGRVTFGTKEEGIDVIKSCKGKVAAFLYNLSSGREARSLLCSLQKASGEKITPVDIAMARRNYIIAALESKAPEAEVLLVWGDDPELVYYLNHHQIFPLILWQNDDGIAFGNVQSFHEPAELSILNMQVDMILCMNEPAPEKVSALVRLLCPTGRLIDACPKSSELLQEKSGGKYVRLDILAYYDFFIESVLSVNL